MHTAARAGMQAQRSQPEEFISDEGETSSDGEMQLEMQRKAVSKS